MASRERVVEFAVKARDEYSKVLNNLEQQQKRLSAAAKASNRREVVGIAQSEIDAAVANYKRLAAEVERLRGVQANYGKTTDLTSAELRELGDAINLTRNRAADAITVIQQKRAALGALNSSAATGFAAFDRLALSMQKEAAAATASKAAELAKAAADEKAVVVAAKKAAIQERLNNSADSGYAHWSRYVDAVNRVRAADEKAAQVALLKAQIQERLNNPAASGYAAFIRTAEGANQQSAAVAGATTQLNKLASASKNASALQTTLQSKVNATTTSLRRMGGSKNGAKGEAQDVEIWGLKPWQLTNLGYQVNDVVSGLAMGQAPLQILSQQAGQFVQIWPGVMVAIARSIPIIGGITVVLAPFIAAAMRLHDTAAMLREFQAELTLSADGARYSAENLAKAAESMGDFGVSTKDARTIVKQFLHDGVSEADILPYARMAKQLDAITGEGVAEAAKRISTAFTGTVDDVRNLDQSLNFLTASELEQIYAMKKSGDSAGALALAQGALADKLRASRSEATPWGEAVDDLGKAWDRLIKSIQDSGLLSLAAKGLDVLAASAKGFADGINGVQLPKFQGGSTPAQQLAAVNQQILDLRNVQGGGITDLAGNSFGNDDTLKQLEAHRDQLLAIVQARQDELTAIKDIGAAQTANNEKSESDKKVQVEVQQVLDKQGETLMLETKQANLTNRERYIEGELLKAKNAALEKAKQLGQDILGLTKEQTDQIRAQAGMSYDTTHPNYEAQFTAQRGTPQGAQMAEIVAAVSVLAAKMQVSAKDLLTAISYETGGTFSTRIKGGAGGKYVGLSQFSPANQAKYGIDENSSARAQVEAMGKYLVAAGVKAGDGLLQIYAAINAGNAKNVNASDEKNGGAPGTVLDKVSEQMDQHKAKAEGALAAYAGIAEQAQKTAEFEKGFDERIAASKLQLDLAKQQNREAFIAKELQDEETRARKAGTELTKEQIQQIKEVSAATYDRAHVEDEVNRLIAQRTALFETLQIAQQAGDQSKVISTVNEISGVETQLTTAIDKAIAFWQAMGGPGADAAIAKLQNVQASIGQAVAKIENQFLPKATDINEKLADIGGNAFSSFAQALANGENAAQAFFDSLLQGIADFLIEIGKAIVKQALFNALSGGAGAAGSGGVGGSIAGWITSLFHDGGVIGQGSSQSRIVNPAIFANAQRFHSGGVAGLGPNEVPIIAMKDEEVLTSDDPRHVANGGRGTAVNLKNINLFDPVDVLEHALSSVPGERVLMNFLTRNSRKVSSAISG